MVGSWAGAMGHTQFMPTSYLEHAQDFNGDGRRDIWSDDPTDALASTAAYLRNFGWTYGQPWGVEVRLPTGFDYALTGERTRRGAGFWRRQGVTLADGSQVPDHGDASILLPGGSEGVALMIFDNFRVIERYNPADAYVIGVGHLSDRIAGGPAFPRRLAARRPGAQRGRAAGIAASADGGGFLHRRCRRDHRPEHAGGRAPVPAVGRRCAGRLRLAQVAGASALTEIAALDLARRHHIRTPSAMAAHRVVAARDRALPPSANRARRVR
jgi:hypothetical protein